MKFFIPKARSIFFAVAILIWLLSDHGTALAQALNVPVRGGQHPSYSRLVFDWSEDQAYSLQKRSDNEFILSFEEPAQLNMERLDVSSLDFISLVQELETEPLKILIEVSSGSPGKAFSLGTKIVFDSGKPAKGTKKSKNSPSNAGRKISEAPPSAPVPDVVEAQDDSNSPIDTVINSNVEQTEESSYDKPVVEVKQKATVKRALPVFDGSKNRPNLITISSVSPTNMAAFKLHNQLWLVNSEEDFLLSPQVSGVQANDIEPLDNIKNENAKVFTANNLIGAEYETQGGGLVWRFLIGSNLNNDSFIKSERFGGQGNSSDGRVVWPFLQAEEIVDITDPSTGKVLKVVTVADPEDYAGPAQQFLEFETLDSPLGLAIVPKVDDLIVEETDRGIEVYRSSGLTITPKAAFEVSSSLKSAKRERLEKRNVSQKQLESQIYNFDNWKLGGVKALEQNETVVLSTLNGLTESGRVEGLLNLGRMYLSNGMGEEALGFLRLAVSALPELQDSADFKALKGAAFAVAGKSEDAFRLLSDPAVADKIDVRYFRSYSLAKLNDWQQAIELLPEELDFMYEYPSQIAIPLGLTLAEVALRAGDVKRGDVLLDIAQDYEDDMRIYESSTLKYLRGEKARQSLETERTRDLWTELADGTDNLHRVKAGLALTRLEVEEDLISLPEAVDRLERLRFVWRGDNLEAQLNYWLGRIYFDYGDFVKGLNIMRDAASYADGPHLGQKIIEDMTQAFTDLYTNPQALVKLPAPEAAALYERFSELIPQGDVGNTIAKNLANHLVNANLYDEATELLEYQLNNRLEGAEAFQIARRLATVALKDENPRKSLEMIEKAQAIKDAAAPDSFSVEESDAIQKELTLLKAQALAKAERTTEALELLYEQDRTPRINALRADLAWRYGFWKDAAEALADVIEDNKNDVDQGLSNQDAELVLQRAVALNLAGDRIRLANMREKFTNAMFETDRAKAFEVVTRPRQSAELVDRNTLLSIVQEVDLFSGFLDSK